MNVDHFPASDETVVSLTFDQLHGGVAAGFAVGLARLGAKSAFIGKIGEDEFGKAIKTELEKEGVDTTGLLIQKKSGSPLSLVMVDKHGERIISHFPGPAPFLNPKEVEGFTSLIKSAKAVAVDGVSLFGGAKAAEIAKQNKIPVLFDLGSPPEALVAAGLRMEDIQRLISLTDVFLPSKLAVHSLSKGEKDFTTAAKRILELGPQTVVLTLGAKGCLVATREGEIIKKPTYKVKVVDTTGAGDAFLAGVGYGIVKGWNIDKTAEYANAVAALKCRKKGARVGLPSAKEAEELMKTGEKLPNA
jgi:sugar/nucleoside kinase (ribokinase family)